jgi:signal transduction histidine kinase
MIWTAIWVLLPRNTLATLSNPEIEAAVKRFDLVVAGLVAAAITLLGRAIVGYAVFTGHPLPRRGFFRQWRSTVILAAGFSFVIGAAWATQLRPFYGLILAALVTTVFHALSSWRAFAEREQFMKQLRPFVASQGLYDRMREGTPPDPAELEALFATLCREVLGARAAVLVPAGALATLAGPPLVHAPGGTRITVPPLPELAAWFSASETRHRPADKVGAAWAVALRQGPDLGGVLLLGEKVDGNPYTEEELEIAQAGGERLLDTLAGTELAGVAMRLLRERVAQVKVLESQGRRVLHDQILPRLHTVILQLGGRRDDPAIRDAVVELTAAHREISDLMHDVTANLPRGLVQQGLAAALRSLVKSEFADDFDAVEWQVEPAAAEAARHLPPFVAEVVYFAAREFFRNAACHGRGGDTDRPLRLEVRLEVAGELRLIVEDNGVGMDASPLAPQPSPAKRMPGTVSAQSTVDSADGAPAEDEVAGGSGMGLRFHSTMLAAVGGRLEVLLLPEGGTRGVVAVPCDHLSS